jgi:hypothetical protein
VEHVRLMCWCQYSVSSLHLPALAADEAGLFAEQGLEVEFMACAPARDRSLRGMAVTLAAVAGGPNDFALTSVAYLLAAHAETGGCFPARFAAILHQRNPIAGLVAAGSGISEPAQLPGRATAAGRGSWFQQEYDSALAHMGLAPAATAPSPGDLRTALAQGSIDVLPSWVDTAPLLDSGELRLRAVPLSVDAYASGLLAADRLPLELVQRMRDALVAGCELQRERPEVGIGAFLRRLPSIGEEHLRASWSAFEPYAFAPDRRPGEMEAERWRATIEHTAAAHGLPAVAGERMFRPELLVA